MVDEEAVDLVAVCLERARRRAIESALGEELRQLGLDVVRHRPTIIDTY